METATRVGFDGPLAVVAFHAVAAGATERIVGALTLNLTAVAPPRFVCSMHGENVYCVVEADRARRLVIEFLSRTAGAQFVVAGIGGEAVAPDALPRSRELADEIAIVLIRKGSAGHAAELHDVYADVLVDRLRGGSSAPTEP